MPTGAMHIAELELAMFPVATVRESSPIASFSAVWRTDRKNLGRSGPVKTSPWAIHCSAQSSGPAYPSVASNASHRSERIAVSSVPDPDTAVTQPNWLAISSGSRFSVGVPIASPTNPPMRHPRTRSWNSLTSGSDVIP